MKQSGRALRCASQQLRGDRTMVLVAVRQNGGALQHAQLLVQAHRVEHARAHDLPRAHLRPWQRMARSP